jgi:hypothetical protein
MNEISADPKPVEIIHLPPDWTAGSKRFGDNSRLRKHVEWDIKTEILTGLTTTWKSMDIIK